MMCVTFKQKCEGKRRERRKEEKKEGDKRDSIEGRWETKRKGWNAKEREEDKRDGRVGMEIYDACDLEYG